MRTIINKFDQLWFRLVLGVLVIILTLAVLPRPQAAPNAGHRATAPQSVFSNPANIDINTAASAPTVPLPWAPYPAPMTVSGLTGNITKLTVSLYGLNDPKLTNFDVLLVGPTGANLIVVSDIGATDATSDMFLTLDDSANAVLSNGSIASGTYRPGNFGAGDTFPAPAPAGPYNSPAPTGSSTLSSVFNGTDPTGDWKLYIVQDESVSTAGVAGYLANGWSLQVTTTGSPATVFSNSAGITFDDVAVPATPYGSVINVSGMTGVVSNITVSLAKFSHARPKDVQILLVSPNGRGFVLMGGVGNNSTSDVSLTFDDAAGVGLPSGTIVSGTYRPTLVGSPSFPAPAPPPPYSATSQGLNSAFGNYSPNGAWSLYVVDNDVAAAGSIAEGWSLNITTVPAGTPMVGCSVANFGTSTTYAAGTAPTGLASADFNGDNKPDLAVANQNSNNVSILLNDGLGGFGAPVNFTAGTNPYAIATGKFDADAFEDLVVVNGGSNNISILLGDGSGGFGSPTNYSAGPSPISVAVADFNNDGKQDLAVADFGGFFSGTVSVLLGTGTGTFGPPLSFGARTQPSFIASDDFNNDGKKDLAVANFGSNNVSILLGTGTGTFTYFSTVLAGSGPVGIAIGDADNDGIPDLAIANYNGNSVTTARGVGDGTFVPGGGPSGLANPISLAYGDLTGDGRPELAIANSGSNTVTLAGPGISSDVVLGGGPYAVVVRDFDGDGRLDLATANNADNNVAVSLNRCLVGLGNRFDFDGDRRTDLSVFRPANVTWYVLFSNSASFTQDVFGGPLDRIVPADFTGEGQTDYATYRPSSGVWSVRNRSDLNRPVYYLQFGLPTDRPVPADYDGDGRADIAVFRPSDGNWYIRQSSDNSLRAMNFGMSGDLPVPADYDGDHIADLAIFRPSDGAWYILNSSNGTMTAVPFGMSGDRPVPNDYDGDGRADVAVYRGGDWYILQSSNGGFRSEAFGMSGDIPVAGDYDRDGKFDIAVFRPSTGIWYSIMSVDNSFSARPWGMNGDTPLPSTDVP